MTAFWPQLDRDTSLPTWVRADLRAMPDSVPVSADAGAPTGQPPAGGGRIPARQLPRRTGSGCGTRRRPTPRHIACLALAVCVLLLAPAIRNGGQA